MSYGAQDSPSQQIIPWPRMSGVPWLRNPAPDLSTVSGLNHSSLSSKVPSAVAVLPTPAAAETFASSSVTPCCVALF